MFFSENHFFESKNQIFEHFEEPDYFSPILQQICYY